MQLVTRRKWLRCALPAAVTTLSDVFQREDPGQRFAVVLRSQDCIAHRGPECGACGELCPAEADGALRIVRGRPVLDPARCTGCGRCVAACPTWPRALVQVAAGPAHAERDTPPATGRP